MTNSISPGDNNDRIERLETLMERLIDVNLSAQNQIGFLAGTLKDTRQATGERFSHLEADVSEINRKIDIILQHITGLGNQNNP